MLGEAGWAVDGDDELLLAEFDEPKADGEEEDGIPCFFPLKSNNSCCCFYFFG
jgi:hypothetical protein